MGKLWDKILMLKKELDAVVIEKFYSTQLFLDDHEDEILVNSSVHMSANPSVYICKDAMLDATNLSHKLIGNWFVYFIGEASLDEDQKKFLLLYLPYCLSTIIAKEQKKAFVVSHFAQTLDGKIATHLGSSKWIGNQENLIHSHRMRALCDGIMVGGKTFEVDTPQLTVRLVNGANPVKIVVSKNKSLRGTENNDIVWIADDVSVREDGILNCDHILQVLFERGINSIYLEGGAHTTSQFLATKNINMVQLHISPIILGSGIGNFSLFPVNEISEGIKFTQFKYHKIGDELMFVGEFIKSNEA